MRAICAVAHDCAPDTYVGEWAAVFAAGDSGGGGGDGATLECEWRVSGPAKSYTSTTRYWRESEQEGDAAAGAEALASAGAEGGGDCGGSALGGDRSSGGGGVRVAGSGGEPLAGGAPP
jgi:hypothetical protein